MDNRDKIFIVIPAYNEEKTVPAVLKDLKTHGYKNIIIIDDGSTDNTGAVARKNGGRTISHPINLGQGSALQTGIEYALSLRADVIITFDADGQHMAEDIKKLLKPLKEGKSEAVLGSRFLDKKNNIPWAKRIVLKGGIILLFLMYGIRLTDTHNGLRAFSRSAAEKLKLESSGMEHASEIIEKIKIEKISFIEIPVTIRYTEYSRAKGQRISNSFRIFLKMLSKWFLK